MKWEMKQPNRNIFLVFLRNENIAQITSLAFQMIFSVGETKIEIYVVRVDKTFTMSLQNVCMLNGCCYNSI